MGTMLSGLGIVAAAISFLAPDANAKTPPADCAGILPVSRPTKVSGRPLTAMDLVRLRDIGSSDRSFPDARLISISPDGGKVAFQLRQADPTQNDYCLAMVVIDLRSGAAPIIVDRGGELITFTMAFRATPAFPTGIPLTIEPQWSTDGRSVFFLKKTRGFVQVWRADTTGQESKAVTDVEFDVEQFFVDDRSGLLLIAGRPGIQQQRNAIDVEALGGFHFNDRYAPEASSRPFPAKPIATEYFAIDLSTGASRPATKREADSLRSANADPGSDLAPALSRHGWSASLRGEVVGRYIPELRLEITDAGRHGIPCAAEECAGRLFGLSWNARGDTVHYLRREGIGGGTTSLYAWTPHSAGPRRLLSTTDILFGCQPANDALLCVREGSTTPRKLVLIDPRTGKSTDVFDPNPELAELSLGKVERLAWVNSLGIETIGDLVYPVGYKPGNRYPLIIVQYDTRGFLRGGTGDEFPIQAFANRGYAVLSVSRPVPIAVAKGINDIPGINLVNLKDFADRRSVQSSLEVIIDKLVTRGIVDRARVGITGLSDGGSTVEFGLVNSSLFAAAATSSCCWDPSMLARVGPAAAREFGRTGYPPISTYDPRFWGQISILFNVARVRTPLLLQMADTEYWSALPTYTALRENNAPVDLYVFPGEYHVKWQPAHRLAVYQRDLDWFDFWLRGVTTDDAGRRNEIDHWEKLKTEARAAPLDADPRAIQ